MMGDGYAVEPVNGNVYAPVSGTVTSVFPTKHAVGILSDQGVESFGTRWIRHCCA